jgi:hypothetical protein
MKPGPKSTIEHIGRAECTLGDTTKTLWEWAKFYKLKPTTIRNRLNVLGWSKRDAFTLPLRWYPKKPSLERF